MLRVFGYECMLAQRRFPHEGGRLVCVRGWIHRVVTTLPDGLAVNQFQPPVIVYINAEPVDAVFYFKVEILDVCKVRRSAIA